MKIKVLYIVRKAGNSPSIERVFAQVARDLRSNEFEVEVQSLPFAAGPLNVFRNLISFRPWPADIYHITGDVHYMALLLPPERTILTIHDLVILHLRSGLRRWVLKKLYLTWPLRRLRYVTAISAATKDEILRETDHVSDEIRVIEDPLIDGFDPAPERSFDNECPVILHIGTAPNKNLSNLIEALKGFECRLRIIGQLGTESREQLDRSGIRFDNVAGLAQPGMTDEYRNCDILSFCSEYEGFGLPIIEAQAMRKPVVTSDREPMRSVAGGGAVLVDPQDPMSIRTAIERIVDNDGLRRKLVEVGQKNIRRFDAKRIAGQYASLYHKIVESRPVAQ